MTESDRVALVLGGDGRQVRQELQGVRIDVRGSFRKGGNGQLNSARTLVKNRSIDLVVLMVRWLGHSEVNVIKSDCKTSKVPYVCIPGGVSSMIVELERHFGITRTDNNCKMEEDMGTTKLVQSFDTYEEASKQRRKEAKRTKLGKEAFRIRKRKLRKGERFDLTLRS